MRFLPRIAALALPISMLLTSRASMAQDDYANPNGPPAPPPGPGAAPPPGYPPPPGYAPPPPGYAPPPAGYPPPPGAYPPPPGAYPPPPGSYPPPPGGYPPGQGGYPPPYDPNAGAPGVRTHDGFYMRLAIGGGALSSTDDVGGGRLSLDIKGAGPAFDMMFGGTLSGGVVLGGGMVFQQATKPTYKFLNTEAKSENNVSFGVLGPFIDWFPDPKGGFHFGGLLGAAILTVDDASGTSSSSSSTTTASASGTGGALFGGYDVWVADQWSLGVLLRAAAGSTKTDSAATTLGQTFEEKQSTSTFAVLFSVLDH